MIERYGRANDSGGITLLIKRIRLLNHPGVGELDLNLCDEHGIVSRLIVLAGGNGVGKTAVLDAVQTALESNNDRGIGTVTLDIRFEERDIPNLDLVSREQGMSASHMTTLDFRLVVNTNNAWGMDKLEYFNGEHQSVSVNFHQEPWRKALRGFYSEANVSFSSQIPSAITSNTVDQPSLRMARSGADLADRITQLLVDIRSADNEDLSKWVHSHRDELVPDGVLSARFSRFTEAFHYMFPRKRFHELDRQEGHVIQFIEDNKISSINELSTGEKQIVFRAGFLLRSRAHVYGGIVLIDEPELSLHPEWQQKITGFYQKILMDSDGDHPQIFMATHSPFIVHGSTGARVIVLQKSPIDGKISQMAHPHYPAVKGEEAVLAFNIDSFLAEAAKPILLLVEGRTDVKIMNTAWDKLRPGIPRPFEARDFLGARNVTHALKDDTIYSRVGERILIGLYDFDDAFDQWHGVWKAQPRLGSDAEGLYKKHPSERGYAFLLPVPEGRDGLASQEFAGRSLLSIEFLFDDNLLPDGVVEQVSFPSGPAPRIKSSKKVEFANAATLFEPSAYRHFEPLISLIEKAARRDI
ncbi:AAA family ATPase [Sphingobium cupriresistens]|uniref:AAA family ATPase n=1 Tax=Sphingobium cupriresistens TaxID=1132417 RepID=UPI003BAE00C8